MTAEMSSGQIFLSKVEERGDGNPQLARSLVIHHDLSWHLCCMGHKLTTCSPPLSSMAAVISSLAEIREILEYVDSCVTCSGNADEKFIPLIAPRKGVFMNASGMTFV